MFELLTGATKNDSVGDVFSVSLDELRDFREKIFRPYEGERSAEMVESVKAYGIITPIIVREIDGGFEILSGHERVRAARVLGHESVPAISRGEIDDDEARFIVTESNIIQRGFMELSLVERAHCVAVRHEAMKQQGIRSDLVKSVDGPELELVGDEAVDTGKVLAESFDLSARNVRRYVRIHSLNDEIKILVDLEKVGMVAGVELSYIKQDEQVIVANVVNEHDERVSVGEAEAIRDLSEAGGFSTKAVEKILVKLASVKAPSIRLSDELISKYFAGVDEDRIVEILELALEQWFSIEREVS